MLQLQTTINTMISTFGEVIIKLKIKFKRVILKASREKWSYVQKTPTVWPKKANGSAMINKPVPAQYESGTLEHTFEEKQGEQLEPCVSVTTIDFLMPHG